MVPQQIANPQLSSARCTVKMMNKKHPVLTMKKTRKLNAQRPKRIWQVAKISSHNR